MSNFDPDQRFSNPSYDFHYANRVLERIGRRLEEAYAARQTTAASESKRQQQTGHRVGAPPPFDWDQCVKDFTLEQGKALFEERGFELQEVHDHALVGSCYVPKWKCHCIAFPIHNKDGNVYQAHCRSPQRDKDDKWAWVYVPHGLVDLHGEPLEVPALVIGKLGSAGVIHIFESQWDGFTLAKTLAWWPLIDAGELCVIVTRGAEFGPRLRNLELPVDRTCYLWPQNDKPDKHGRIPSQDWLHNAGGSLNGAVGRVVVTPKEFNGKDGIKDPNDWTRTGAGVMELETAILNAEVYQAPPEPTPEEKEDLAEPNWEKEVEEISIDELLSFDRTNDPDSRIGNRWLCRGDTVVIQGETGIGKSTLVMQKIIHWAMGDPIFGIKAKGTLKSLLIESENNKGDLAEVFQDVTRAMGLSAEQIAYLKTKIVIVRECAKTGPDFLKLARRLIKRHKPDLVFADPLLSYADDDIARQKAMSAFLRNGLQPIVHKSGVIWFWVHHFSKPPRNDKPANRRSVYSGFGSIEIAGWARETITVNVINDEERVCEIDFGKRARRVGLADDDGNPIYKLYIQQSKNGVLWDLADPAIAKKAAGEAAKYGKAEREIRRYIEQKVNVTHSQLKKHAPQIPIGKNTAIDIAKAIVDDQGEPRIYEYPMKGRTNRSLGFSTVEQALNPRAFASKKRAKKQPQNRNHHKPC